MALGDLSHLAEGLADFAEAKCRERLEGYTVAPHDAREHYSIEEAVLAGGYSYRQVAELVQNAADAVFEGGAGSGRIEVALEDGALWAANTGAPLDANGVLALLNAHSSGKRESQIGRFGLGFKSMLGLGGRVVVLSRSVSLLFDADRCRRRIRDHLGLPAEAPAPAMRLADVASWEQGCAVTPGAERYDWATTVVRVALEKAGAAERISEEMRAFPAEFLLFLAGDVELTLRADGLERRLRRRTHDDGVRVVEDFAEPEGKPQRWRVFERQFAVVDEAARQDATGVHARETVPLIWAAPVGSGQSGAGRFFAFFPTSTDTRTLGILNAPWKLNSDRTALISGAWNDALMRAAGALIVDSMPILAADGDPGAPLDALPRELPRMDDPAAPLASAIWEEMVSRGTLPDCDARSVDPRTLRRAPIDDVEIMRAWSRLAPADACSTHLHPACGGRERAGRLNVLAKRLQDRGAPGALERTPARRWLELTADSDPEIAVEVLELLSAFARVRPVAEWDELRDELRVLPSAEGALITAPEASLSADAEPPLSALHPALVSDPGSRHVLIERFGLREEAGTNWERLLDTRLDAADARQDWSEVWALLRLMSWRDLQHLVPGRPIPVHSLNGWRRPEICLRPGRMLTEADLGEADEDSSADLRGWLLDETFHHSDSAILDLLQVSDTPARGWAHVSRSDPDRPAAARRFLEKWELVYLREYHSYIGGKADRSLLQPATYRMPIGWELLTLTRGDAAARVSAHLLSAVDEDWANRQLGGVIFRHRTRPYGERAYPHPLWYLICGLGVFKVGHGELSGAALLVDGGPARAACVPSLNALAVRLQRLQQCATSWSSGEPLKAAWAAWFEYLAGEAITLQPLATVWEEAAKDQCRPATVPTLDGPVDLSEVLVARSARDAVDAEAAGFACVALSQGAADFWIAGGARPLEAAARLVWTPGHDDEARLLVELEPALGEAVDPDTASKAKLLFVSDLRREWDGRIQPLDKAVTADGRLLVDEGQWASIQWRDQVTLLVEAGRSLGWIRTDDALAQVLEGSVPARRRRVADGFDLPDRLLTAIGLDAILVLFDEDLRAELGKDPLRAASVAINMLGPALFSDELVRVALDRAGLQPPARWGSEEAARFVSELGFPTDFAVSQTRRRPPEVTVSGPSPLKPLHDYQVEVVAAVDGLLEDLSGRRRRAVVSLPTGAGKTRVAAEAAVTRVLGTGRPNRLVLWIAQTDELCEQAVQCFRQLWTNLGPAGEDLRLVRLWDGQANPAPPERDEATVVVASIQTLTLRRAGEALDWISRPGLVVVDECHHALTKSYTGLFRWLGDAEEEDRGGEPPVLGLSATPFRGRDEEATKQLARRFDGRLIPADQAGLFERLQAKGVLARFRYTRLEMEREFDLSKAEEEHFLRFNALPDTALERLGRDEERNDRILQEIAAAEERSALVFATSVAHARRLAARLNMMGVPAAVVSGETNRASRRWFISAFQRGDVRVLCNHSALTTGFDAPATDLVVVARPVFSPSLYMQMVGRGLRGPLNGGKPLCRILTVQDNLDLHSDRLAHHYFEKYYVDEGSAA